MKTVGLIGGIAWPSTLEYYRILNQLTSQRLGNGHSAKLVLVNLDMAEITQLMGQNDEEGIYQILLSAGKTLQDARCEVLALCANGVHRFYTRLSQDIDVEIVNIAEATALAIKSAGLKRVGLLGVRQTMEGAFYPEKLTSHGIEVLLPEKEDREYIHQTIFDELVNNKFLEGTRSQYRKIIESLIKRGAQGVILGCTEIPLLISNADAETTLFPTTELHCQKIMDTAFATK